jgi:hypothetical protein
MKPSIRSIAALAYVAMLLAVVGMFQVASAQVAQISGKVTLKQADGTEVPVTNGREIASESTMKTDQNSSAVVSLGKLGRVEVFSDTLMKLSYDSSAYTIDMLSRGRVRISTMSGNVTVTTPQGAVVAEAGKRTVVVIDTTCGDTFISVSKGSVELRAGNTVKQIAAGGQDTAGQAAPGCSRIE